MAQMKAHLVANDLAFGVVLKVAVALESALDDLTELGCKGLVIEQMVHAQARARRLGGVRRTNTLLGCADAGTAQFYLLQPVNDLMEVEDEMGPIGDEQASGAIET